MNEESAYALIHSPLVGPLTWSLVAREMERRGVGAIAPSLVDDPNLERPFWQQHAGSIAESLARIPRNQSIVLVAHSGAGPLLPIIRQSAARPIRSYVFVDAGLPRNNLSRIDLMRLQDEQPAVQLHQILLQGGAYPTWNADDLREVIPDDILRRKMVSEVRPRSLAFFTEPIPVFSGWPDAPCAYIKFSAPYAWDFSQAKQAGWLVHELPGGHFHMLVDPPAVTDMILDAVQELSDFQTH